METGFMNLKVLLPYKVFTEVKNVSRIVAETSNGSYGFLPQRLDCVAALIPGILTYETEANELRYIAIDEGVLVKAGTDVLISVRNAVGSGDLGKLHEMIQQQFLNLDESEKQMRSVVAKMESGLLRTLNKYRED